MFGYLCVIVFYIPTINKISTVLMVYVGSTFFTHQYADKHGILEC